MDPLDKVGLHPADADVFMIQSIVSLLQGQCMIPNKTSLPEHRIEVLRLGSLVKFVLVCYHVLFWGLKMTTIEGNGAPCEASLK